MRSNGKTAIRPGLPRGRRIRKTFHGVLTTLILVGLLSGLLLSVIALNGLVVNLDDHRSVLAKVLDATRAALLAIPGSWGPRVVGIMSPAEATETMVVCSEELLRDLAAVADELEAAGLAPADRLPPEFPGLRALTAAGIETFSDVRSLEDVSEIKGIGPKLARRIGESAA